MLTRCPNCGTRFRVTSEQLGIAAGKVRCGNCMEVFNAIEHRSPPLAAQPQQPPAAPARPVAPVGSGLSAEEELIFEDNPDEDASEGRYAGKSASFSNDELSDSFLALDEDASSSGFGASGDHDGEAGIDESWAEAMLDDDGRNAGKPATPGLSEEPRRPTVPTPPPSRSQADVGRSQEAPLTPEADSPARPQATARPQADKGAPDSGKKEAARNEAQASEPFGGAEPRPTGRKTGAADSAKADRPYNNLGREPISVGRKGTSGWLRTLVWMIILLGLLGVLVAQVTWYQFDRLSAIPELRPFYEKGCELAGCQLKPLIDTDRIQSRKLVVRTDPDNRNALVVDAVIINEADFVQPFPAIALTFSNLNGDVVAQSLFPPTDYLAGEAAALDGMPPETPVRIALKIRDPGRDAVNYNIAFRPHQP